jgi:hypothetical protein
MATSGVASTTLKNIWIGSMVIQQEMNEKNVVACEEPITDGAQEASINTRAPCRYVFAIVIARLLSARRSRANLRKDTLQDWVLSDNPGTLSAVFSSRISPMQRRATDAVKLDTTQSMSPTVR